MNSVKNQINDRNIKYYIFILLIFLIPRILQSQTIEYSVKASYIEKFARYTEWNSNSIKENFVINVLGNSPFNGELEKLAKRTKIKNRQIEINYIQNYLDIKDCQVLFICSSEQSKLPEIIHLLKNRSILTISETPGFSEQGVHYNFYFDENETIHFEVNLNALKNAHLKPDMQLLIIGKIIKQ